MRIQNFVLGLLLVTGIVMGMYSAFGEIGEQYGNSPAADLESYNRTNEAVEGISNSYSDLIASPLSPTSFLGGLGLVWKVIKFAIVAPFAIANDILASISGTLGLPGWFTILAAGTLVVLVMFGLINMILRWRA